jgi:hypothetical protein
MLSPQRPHTHAAPHITGSAGSPPVRGVPERPRRAGAPDRVFGKTARLDNSLFQRLEFRVPQSAGNWSQVVHDAQRSNVRRLQIVNPGAEFSKFPVEFPVGREFADRVRIDFESASSRLQMRSRCSSGSSPFGAGFCRGSRGLTRPCASLDRRRRTWVVRAKRTRYQGFGCALHSAEQGRRIL